MIELQGRGGFWQYASLLSSALLQVGVDTALATLAPFEPVEGAEGVRVLSIAKRLWKPNSWASFGRVRQHVNGLGGLRRVLAERRPGIVHLQGPIGMLDFTYFRWLKAQGARVVYTAHNPRPRTGKTGWLERARFREVDAIVVLSAVGMSDLTADGVDRSKIFLVPHGNYLAFCQRPLPTQEAKALLGLPADAQAILFFGAIAPYKGLDLLIEAFAELSAGDPNLFLIVAGAPREDFSSHFRCIQRFHLGTRVILDLQYIPFLDFPKYFCAADVVVFPYRRAYQSGALQLAYGFGKPVVVSDVRDLAEAVVQDRSGVVASSDAGSMAAAIRQVLADPTAARLMGRRGREAAETTYAWQTVAQRVVEVYRHLDEMRLDEMRAPSAALVRDRGS